MLGSPWLVAIFETGFVFSAEYRSRHNVGAGTGRQLALRFVKYFFPFLYLPSTGTRASPCRPRIPTKLRRRHEYRIPCWYRYW